MAQTCSGVHAPRADLGVGVAGPCPGDHPRTDVDRTALAARHHGRRGHRGLHGRGADARRGAHGCAHPRARLTEGRALRSQDRVRARRHAPRRHPGSRGRHGLVPPGRRLLRVRRRPRLGHGRLPGQGRRRRRPLARRRRVGAGRTATEGARGEAGPPEYFWGYATDSTDAAGPSDGPVDQALTSSTGPTITSITPGEASAGTDTHVTISGQGFGSTTGQVAFSYGRDGVMRIDASDISSWTDTAISCAVPTGIIDNYSASAGSGPVVVTTAAYGEAAPYAFAVPFGYGGSKWASPGLTYLVNTSGIDSVRRETLADAGTSVWNGGGSGFRFTDGGPTSAGFSDDGLNIIPG